MAGAFNNLGPRPLQLQTQLPSNAMGLAQATNPFMPPQMQQAPRTSDAASTRTSDAASTRTSIGAYAFGCR
jgi:hypothetical protein